MGFVYENFYFKSTERFIIEGGTTLLPLIRKGVRCGCGQRLKLKLTI
jgi:hypothetical protein